MALRQVPDVRDPRVPCDRRDAVLASDAALVGFARRDVLAVGDFQPEAELPRCVLEDLVSGPADVRRLHHHP